MSFSQVAGVWITRCHYRERYRTFYFDKSWPGDRKSGLIFVKKGSLAFEINGKRFVAQKNDVVLWDAGLLGRMLPFRGAHASYYAVSMDIVYASGWTGSLGFPCVVRMTEPRPTLSLLHEIYRTVNSGNRHARQLGSILGLRLLCLIDENLCRRIKPPGNPFLPADERLRNVLLHIEARYKSRLDMKELTAVAGLCRAQLSRLFKRQTGMSPHQYVLEKKMSKAREFLLMATETPTSISLDLGFHDYPHFCRTFKRMVGTGPSAFIRQHFQRDYH